ncbi:hypothetical protein BB561_002624 [Smittium simulii]|uniref:DNA repair metallo-beta-lactamase domain-containing protein n=1 Tax=Smittium simulii TaxID=133385 RepID=A0A2T9YQ00_9FUNG|nr:hypothetical protein BB561_002624 [Smittium simulii]
MPKKLSNLVLFPKNPSKKQKKNQAESRTKQLDLLQFKTPIDKNKTTLQPASKTKEIIQTAKTPDCNTNLKQIPSSNFDHIMLGIHTSTVCFICNKKINTPSFIKVTKHINECLDISENSYKASQSLSQTSSKTQSIYNFCDKIQLSNNNDIEKNSSSPITINANKSRQILYPKEKIAHSLSSSIKNPVLNASSAYRVTDSNIAKTEKQLHSRYSILDKYKLPKIKQNITPVDFVFLTSSSDTENISIDNCKKIDSDEAYAPLSKVVENNIDSSFNLNNMNSSGNSCNKIFKSEVHDSDTLYNIKSTNSINFLNKTKKDQENNSNLDNTENQNLSELECNKNYENLPGTPKNPFIEPLLQIDNKNYALDTSNRYLVHHTTSKSKKHSFLNNPEMKAEVLQRELDKAVLWNKEYCLSKLNKSTHQADKKVKTYKKKCPSHKFMPGTNFTVDAFAYGKLVDCTGYFLTHFHSDHYGGLTSKFNNGMIYCSHVTGNLIIENLKVNPKYVCRLPFNRPILIEDTVVTLFDANHCPGSAMFFFDTLIEKGGLPRERILHTGDFRACPEHIKLLKKTAYFYNKIDVLKLCSFNSCFQLNNTDDKSLVDLDTTQTNRIFGFYELDNIDQYESIADDQSKVIDSSIILSQIDFNNEEKHNGSNNGNNLPPVMNLINKIYLDTTYMKSDYTFPAQQEVIEAVTHLCKAINDNPHERILHVQASRNIGSVKTIIKSTRTEDILGDSLEETNELVYTSALTKWFKPKIDESIVKILTDKPEEAQVHVVSLNNVKKQDFFHSLVAFRPTGWTYQSKMGHPSYVSSSTLGPPGADNFLPHKLRMDIPAADELKRIEFYMDTVVKTGIRSPLLLSYELGSKCVPNLPPVPFTKTSITPFGNSDRITIFPVPYSEHSSYRELAAFICSVACDEVIPTVDCEKVDKLARMKKTFELWQKAKKVVNSVYLDSIRSEISDVFCLDKDTTDSKNINSMETKITQNHQFNTPIDTASSNKSHIPSKKDIVSNNFQIIDPISLKEPFDFSDNTSNANHSDITLDNNNDIKNASSGNKLNFANEAVLMVPTRCQGEYW